jgi:hypothetical protein
MNIGFKAFAVIQPPPNSNKYRLGEEIAQRCRKERIADVEVYEKPDTDEVMIYHPSEELFQNCIRPAILDTDCRNASFGPDGKYEILLENWKIMGT